MNAMMPATAAPRSWETLKAAFDAALALEKQFDALHIHSVTPTREHGSARNAETDKVPAWVWAVSERLTDARSDAEEALIFYPAPDLAAALWKIEYARPRWQDVVDWPDAWWSAVIADLRRLSEVEPQPIKSGPISAEALIAAMDDIDTRSKFPATGVSDDEAFGWFGDQDAILEQVCALPNTHENLAVRARAIGCAVDNTSDLAKLDLHELCARLPERGVTGGDGPTGMLIRQVLACCMGIVA